MGARQGYSSPVQKRLRELGFRKVRQRKHQIWQSPHSKRKISVAVSPSDVKTVNNELSRVNRLAREEGLI